MTNTGCEDFAKITGQAPNDKEPRLQTENVEGLSSDTST